MACSPSPYEGTWYDNAARVKLREVGFGLVSCVDGFNANFNVSACSSEDWRIYYTIDNLREIPCKEMSSEMTPPCPEVGRLLELES
jgi:hypothetical protein